MGLRPAYYAAAGIMASGMFCGLAGAWLALHAGQFARGMSAGRGFIALAALITGNRRPLRVAAVCFGLAAFMSLQRFLSLSLPTQLLESTPYLITLVVLTGLAARSRPPRALAE